MSPLIPTSQPSSSASAQVIVLRPSASRFLRLWWVGLHGLVLASVPWLGLPALAAVGLALLVAAHGFARRPRAAPVLLLERDGRWSVPEHGLAGLSIASRTRYTTLWVRLALVGGTRSLDILLLADQLDPESWRILQTRLRRSSGVGGRRGGLGPHREHPNDLR